MNSTKNLVIFSIGFIIGSLTTWKTIKDKYEKIAQDEIDSVKAVFSHNKEDKERNEVSTNQEGVVNETKPGIMEYAAMLQEKRYSNTDNGVVRPYVIHPNDFGENDEYSKVSLTYYADGVLVDEDDERIENIDNLVGIESLNHFGEYEDDSVYVRNDEMRCYYEILLDSDRYEDIARGKYIAEV